MGDSYSLMNGLYQFQLPKVPDEKERPWHNLYLKDIEGEIWLPIEGYEGVYNISNFSRIKSLFRESGKPLKGNGKRFWKEKILKHQKGANYPVIRLTKLGIQSNHIIHILLATAFIQNPNNLPVLNHKNGDKYDLTLDNLEWTTSKENTAHAFRTGLMSHKGIKNANCKFSEDVILEIFNSDLPYKEISEKFGIARNSVSQIKNGGRWSHLTGKVFIKNKLHE